MRHLQVFARALVRRPLLTEARADFFLRAAIAAAGMQVIAGPLAVLGTVPGNEGVSACAILDFSSASVHEWPDHRPHPLVHFDLYTCGPEPDVARLERLFANLDPVEYAARVVDRDALLRAG